MTRLLLLFVVCSNGTLTKAFVARLFENENSINAQSKSRNNQGPVRFRKKSRLVAKKAKLVNHSEQTKLFKAMNSSSIFGNIALAKSKSRLVFGVAIANKSKSINDAQIDERSGVVGDCGFVHRKESAFSPRPQPAKQTLA